MPVSNATPTDPLTDAPVRVAVTGRTRWALWWADELTDDPRFALAAESDADAVVRGEPGRTIVEVPDGPHADALPFRPARFTAAFAAARSAVHLF